ncbi:MAG: ABC transporter permease, partial [Spirochaetaceae bacterium]|nr:ABC transporter permease [Spirochaetaceae bacterium]
GGEQIEAVITEEAAATGRLVYDTEYRLVSLHEDISIELNVRIVGVVAVEDPSDIFWSMPVARYAGDLLVHTGDVRRIVASDPFTRNVEAAWSYTFDYHAMTSETAASMVQFVQEQTEASRRLGVSVRMPVLRILEAYAAREKALKLTLWVLQVPLLLMLSFYLFMVSQVLIDHERNEIALVKSRGADNSQVFVTYLLLGAMLSAAGLLVGPFLGMAICRALGASNGFLEFVQRRRLRLEFTPQTYVYAVSAAALALITMLLPAFQGSRTTIVLHKLRQSQKARRPIWKVLFVDVIALGISIYGLYRYRARSEIIQLAGLEASELAVDPMLFFVSTLFVVGAGLLFLRIYPIVIRLIFRIGQRRWSPAAFSSLVQVGRGGGRDQFLMLFIILSISVGAFNAIVARTLNQNIEEQIRYNLGADIVVQEEWARVSATGSVESGDSGPPGAGGPPTGEEPSGRYVEPEFRRFQELPGVAQASRVFRQQRASGRVFGGESFGSVTLLGIIPHEFGRIAWFRNGLLPYHWHNYLNLMAESPAAALVSSSLRDLGVELGDPICLTWQDQPSTLFYVYGFVDFWPTFNPYGSSANSSQRHLAVVNLPYLQAMTALEPYEVWLQLEPETTSQELYDSIHGLSSRILRVTDANQELIRARNDPLLQGTNGTLSLGFLVSLGVCFVGFLIYWTFAIRERTLQFGLFRAMGMTKSGIVRMLAIEQILISGVAIAAGFAIGRLTSELFAPLLQVGKNAADTVPPFRVISMLQDQLRIGGFVLLMMLLGFVILSVFLARIRIHQAVKLGEE